MSQKNDIFEEIISTQDIVQTLDVEYCGAPVTFILHIYSYAASYWKRVIECMLRTLTRQYVELTVEEKANAFDINRNKDVFMKCRIDMRRLDMNSMWKLLQLIQQKGPIGYVDVCGTRISDQATNMMEMNSERLALCAEFMHYTFSAIKHTTWEDCVKFVSNKCDAKEAFPLECCNFLVPLQEKLYSASALCSFAKGRSFDKKFLRMINLNLVSMHSSKLDFSTRHLSVFKNVHFDNYIKEHIEELPIKWGFYYSPNNRIRVYFFYLGYIISDEGKGGFVTIIYHNTNINRTLGEFKRLLFNIWE
jgi:hypothetical protein